MGEDRSQDEAGVQVKRDQVEGTEQRTLQTHAHR